MRLNVWRRQICNDRGSGFRYPRHVRVVDGTHDGARCGMTTFLLHTNSSEAPIFLCGLLCFRGEFDTATQTNLKNYVIFYVFVLFLLQLTFSASQ